MESETKPSQDGDKNEEVFKPIIEQIYYARAWADPATKPTRSDAARTAMDMMKTDGVATPINLPDSLRKETYRWEQDKAYCQWFTDYWQSLMKSNIAYLDSVGLKKAVSDFRYWEAMQMKFGGYKRKHDMTSDDKPISTPIDTIANILLEAYKNNGDNRKTDTPEQSGTPSN